MEVGNANSRPGEGEKGRIQPTVDGGLTIAEYSCADPSHSPKNKTL